MIEGDGEPETEGPALEEREREPGDPEAGAGGQDGEVDVLDVMRIPGGDRAKRRGRLGRLGAGAGAGGIRGRLATEPGHRRGREVEAGAGEELGDADLAQRREGGAEPVDELGDEGGEAVHRRGGLDQRLVALLVEAAHLVGDRVRRDQEPPRRLGDGPAACGAEGQDGDALDRRIVGAVAGRDGVEAGAEDPVLLADKRELSR